ncbi:MAG: DUF2804 domain-containing protein, partial [Spirochaetaceae bacterium]|nr:DUF2804 domain-containing protein [Spirochaetaceae bacterium]
MPQIEMSAPLSVLDRTGHPVNFGWARSPFFIYNAFLSRGPVQRVIASDRYIVFSPTHLIILEILDGGYLGYAGISVASLKDKKRSSQIFQHLIPLGSLGLPDSGESGPVKFQRKNRANIEFIPMEKGVRLIKVDIPKFGHHRYLRGAIVLSPPDQAESLVTNMPWRTEKNAFILSRRSPWYVVEGVMQFGTTELIFTRGNAWGILDWNRGSRPRQDVHYWASACGMSGGRQAGFSVGYSSADGSAGTENAFFVDGKLHKLDQVTFHLSPANWLAPWRFTGNDNRLEMTFAPHQERVERYRLGFHSLKRRQVYGSFSGSVILDDGEELRFQ